MELPLRGFLRVCSGPVFLRTLYYHYERFWVENQSELGVSKIRKSIPFENETIYLRVSTVNNYEPTGLNALNRPDLGLSFRSSWFVRPQFTSRFARSDSDGDI